MSSSFTDRKILKTQVLFVLSIFFSFSVISQGVGINATGAAPDKSALLDLSSTNKGFLITRVDTVNINTPAFGLMTLAPIDSCLYLYNGNNWMGMGGGGGNCSCNCGYLNPSSNPTPEFPCGGTVIPIVDVTNAITGKTWMDRNLGANQVATSSKDAAAYGDLYQWGRCSDGHEKRMSNTTSTLSLSDSPGHGSFILPPASPSDWRNPQNDNLWQGASGINNPCPTGYRLPTEVELTAEVNSWSSNNATGAFNSSLKLTVTGYRFSSNGTLGYVGTTGYSWSSTISGTQARYLRYGNSSASMINYYRAYGISVRCIKD